MSKDKHTEADRLLRDGLDSLQPDSPVGSWEHLAKKLDEQSALPLSDATKTDETLRNRLNAIQPDYQAESWKVLESRLDSTLDEVVADELLQTQLNSVVPPYAPESWTVLSNKLDNSESDELLHHRLVSTAAVPKVSGWAALAAKLELIAARRTAIYSYKFSELCLVMTFMLLFWRFVPLANSAQPTIPDNSPQAIAQQEDQYKTPTTAKLYDGTLPAATPFPSDVSPSTEGNSIKQEAASLTLTNSTETRKSVVNAAEVAFVQTTEASAPITDDSPALVLTVNEITVVEPLAITLADHLIIEEDGPSPLANLAEDKDQLPVAKTFHLRPFISPWDINQVVTPKQAVNDIILERDNRLSYGSSAGVLLDVTYRKHSVQYGIIYGRRSYIPTVLKDVEAFEPGQGPIERRDTNYSRISLQNISLPVVFQRELFNKNRWRMTIDAGLAANFNIWSRFRKSPTFDADVLNWTRQTPQSLSGIGRTPETRNLNRIDARDLVFPEEGLFQGGSLLENVNISASLGFSIERQFNERMSFYVAPRFSRAIYYQKSAGVEPFNDRIHNNSVQFGTRILLGKQK